MRRSIHGLIAGAGTAALGALLGLMPVGASFEQSVGLAWLFELRGSIPAPRDVVVVAIDEQTGSHLGLSRLPREWPRSVHGRLVDNLTRRGVSAIVFDFDFQIAKDPQDDTTFGRAVADSGRVILTQKLIGKRQPLVNASGIQTGSVWVEQLIPPIPVLAEAAKGLGPFPLPKVQVAVHQFWAFKSSIGHAPTMPSVALQIHAIEAYRHLAGLLEQNGVLAPPVPSASVHALEIGKLMRELRSIFNKNPDLSRSLSEILDHDESLAIPSAQRPLVQSLIRLYAGDDHRYLNFYGPPGGITAIPYHLVASDPKVVSESQLPDLNGKVAFVGFSDLYDPGQPDRFFTVFTNDDGVDLSGVEIAATAFANLLTDRSLRPLGILEQTLTLAIFGGLIGALVYLLPAIAGVPLVLILQTGYLIGAYRAFVESDVWLPISIPLLVQFPLALFGGLFAQYLLERRKKARATQAISLYLPENLARDFTEKNLDQSALNRVTYSVCFASDMAGFTSIAEKLRPKDLAAFLNEYFEVLSAPLKRHGVDVIEFRADGIMCAWTAERPSAVIHRKALLAGLEAVDAIAGFRKRYALLSQSLRIGVEAGMAYVGHAGGGGHFVYSIVGDCANTAARIEGLNKHVATQFLASRAVVEGIDGLLTRFLGEFRFVGKAEAVPILEILALEKTAAEIQKRLCERFAIAMEKMRSECWREACDAFESILLDYPRDGPSGFHLARCRRFTENPPNESPWIVRMDAK